MTARKLGRVATAAASGDQRAALEAIRDQLAGQLEKCEPAVAAQIAGQLRATLKDLAALPAAREGSKTDEVKQRREKRLAAAQAPPPASGRGGHRR